jgi:hypothetical protein
LGILQLAYVFICKGGQREAIGVLFLGGRERWGAKGFFYLRLLTILEKFVRGQSMWMNLKINKDE